MTRKHLVIGCIGIAALLLLFLFRYTLITTFSDIVYKPDVASQFDKQFSSVNPYLEELGFTFTGSPPLGYASFIDKCRTTARGRVSCSKSRHSDEIAVTQYFIDKWYQQAPVLEKHLLDSGWQPLASPEAMQALYDNPDNIGNKALFYDRTDPNNADARCSLMISHTLYTATGSVELSCSRDIRFPDVRDTVEY